MHADLGDRREVGAAVRAVRRDVGVVDQRLAARVAVGAALERAGDGVGDLIGGAVGVVGDGDAAERDTVDAATEIPERRADAHTRIERDVGAHRGHRAGDEGHLAAVDVRQRVAQLEVGVGAFVDRLRHGVGHRLAELQRLGVGGHTGRVGGRVLRGGGDHLGRRHILGGDGAAGRELAGVVVVVDEVGAAVLGGELRHGGRVDQSVVRDGDAVRQRHVIGDDGDVAGLGAVAGIGRERVGKLDAAAGAGVEQAGRGAVVVGVAQHVAGAVGDDDVGHLGSGDAVGQRVVQCQVVGRGTADVLHLDHVFDRVAALQVGGTGEDAGIAVVDRAGEAGEPRHAVVGHAAAVHQTGVELALDRAVLVPDIARGRNETHLALGDVDDRLDHLDLLDGAVGGGAAKRVLLGRGQLVGQVQTVDVWLVEGLGGEQQADRAVRIAGVGHLAEIDRERIGVGVRRDRGRALQIQRGRVAARCERDRAVIGHAAGRDDAVVEHELGVARAALGDVEDRQRQEVGQRHIGRGGQRKVVVELVGDGVTRLHLRQAGGGVHEHVAGGDQHAIDGIDRLGRRARRQADAGGGGGGDHRARIVQRAGGQRAVGDAVALLDQRRQRVAGLVVAAKEVLVDDRGQADAERVGRGHGRAVVRGGAAVEVGGQAVVGQHLRDIDGDDGLAGGRVLTAHAVFAAGQLDVVVRHALVDERDRRRDVAVIVLAVAQRVRHHDVVDIGVVGDLAVDRPVDLSTRREGGDVVHHLLQRDRPDRDAVLAGHVGGRRHRGGGRGDGDGAAGAGIVARSAALVADAGGRGRGLALQQQATGGFGETCRHGGAGAVGHAGIGEVGDDAVVGLVVIDEAVAGVGRGVTRAGADAELLAGSPGRGGGVEAQAAGVADVVDIGAVAVGDGDGVDHRAAVQLIGQPRRAARRTVADRAGDGVGLLILAGIAVLGRDIAHIAGGDDAEIGHDLAVGEIIPHEAAAGVGRGLRLAGGDCGGGAGAGGAGGQRDVARAVHVVDEGAVGAVGDGEAVGDGGVRQLVDDRQVPVARVDDGGIAERVIQTRGEAADDRRAVEVADAGGLAGVGAEIRGQRVGGGVVIHPGAAAGGAAVDRQAGDAGIRRAAGGAVAGGAGVAQRARAGVHRVDVVVAGGGVLQREAVGDRARGQRVLQREVVDLGAQCHGGADGERGGVGGAGGQRRAGGLEGALGQQHGRRDRQRRVAGLDRRAARGRCAIHEAAGHRDRLGRAHGRRGRGVQRHRHSGRCLVLGEAAEGQGDVEQRRTRRAAADHGRGTGDAEVAAPVVGAAHIVGDRSTQEAHPVARAEVQAVRAQRAQVQHHIRAIARHRAGIGEGDIHRLRGAEEGVRVGGNTDGRGG